jgi:hypothetical protein
MVSATEALLHEVMQSPQSPLLTNENDDDKDKAEDHTGREVMVMDHHHPRDPHPCRHQSPPHPPPPVQVNAVQQYITGASLSPSR